MPASIRGQRTGSTSSMAPKLRKNKSGPMPQEFDVGHDLCLVLHDLLVELLKSGEEGNLFTTSIEFTDEADRAAFESSPDIFEWLAQNRRLEDRARVLTNVVLPAVLSDLLHCIYEALESSRKGKLGTAYMLIRKPLQENLFLLESVVMDPLDFAEKLANEPLLLRGLKGGGVDVHTKRIDAVLKTVKETHRLSAPYLAQLRYDKHANDGFDGICNVAMHLFTAHPAIRTEPLNVNFIFSRYKEKLTQWSYLYSRLPYLLFYLYRVVEHIAQGIAPTLPAYVQDVERRIAALIVLWWPTVKDDYRTEALEAFFSETSNWLSDHCEQAHCRAPTKRDLNRMARCGALPGEPAESVRAREAMYELLAAANREAAGEESM